MTRAQSGIDLAILTIVSRAPVCGLAELTNAINASTRRYVRRRLERLQQAQLLALDYPPVFPGRGNKIVIRKISQ